MMMMPTRPGALTVTFLRMDGATDSSTDNENFGSADNGPDVLKIARVGEPFVKVTSATFDIHVLLSEDVKGGLVADLIDPGEIDRRIGC